MIKIYIKQDNQFSPYKKINNKSIIQRSNFKKLLKTELNKEMKYILNGKYSNFKIKIADKKIKYKRPKYSLLYCTENVRNYSFEFYIPINIKHKNKNLCQNKYVLGGEIPIMTEKGTFIINGKRRVVISQIIRSPGIYFEKNEKENSYMCTIIPQKGGWLVIKINKEDIISSKLEGINNKIPILTLLQGLGLSKKKILSLINKKELLNKNMNKKILNTKDALNNLYNIYEEGSINQKQSKKLIFIRNYIYSKLMNLSQYNLSEVGRLKINLKIYKKEYWKKTRVLQPEDILGAIQYLIKVKSESENEDDIDNLNNKRIRTVGELIQTQIRLIEREIKEDLTGKLKKLEKTKKEIKSLKIKSLINNKKITRNIEQFFVTNPLSQIIDETNSLAEITQKRKIKAFGTKSADKEKAKANLREIQPSQYSRLCPIETVEGKNAGLILSFAQEIIINKYGFIESPYYKIIKQKIIRKKGTFFISAKQEKQLILAPSDLLLDKTGSEILMKRNKEFRTEKTKINFISVSTNQILSIGTGLIPFIEHNDANRALMGSNMQRQAISLMKKETAIVQTGLEKLVGKNTDKTILAKKSGKIKFSSNKKIKIIEKENERKIYKNNKSIMKKMKKKIKAKFSFDNKKYKIKTYTLQINQKSNQNTDITNTNLVMKNQWVEKGQTIADSKSTLNGKLAIGNNILIGYMSYEGYNFEDAIVINEKIVENDKFTSKHIKKYKTFLSENEFEGEKITKNISTLRLNDIKCIGKNGVIKKGSSIKKETTLVGKIRINKKMSTSTKLLNSLFPNKQNVKNVSLRTQKDTRGIILKTKILRKQCSYSITIYIMEKRKIKIGDKLSGRHGNKGIISAITKIEDMPYTQDGTSLDLLLNPLGIPSRMNVGQILECLLGLAGKNLIENYKVKLFDEMNRKEISTNTVYKKLYEARKKTNKKWLFKPDNPGKTKLFNGKTGLTFEQPVTIGYSYILKLMHLVDDKIHSRSTGPYSLISTQPLRGRGKNGGQRFGEMEVWSLEGFGAAYTLQELFSIKSDDLTNRTNIMFNVLKSEIIHRNEISESLKILIIELQCLGIDIKINYNSKKRFFLNKSE